jgi:hypothetical protein
MRGTTAKGTPDNIFAVVVSTHFGIFATVVGRVSTSK